MLLLLLVDHNFQHLNHYFFDLASQLSTSVHQHYAMAQLNAVDLVIELSPPLWIWSIGVGTTVVGPVKSLSGVFLPFASQFYRLVPRAAIPLMIVSQQTLFWFFLVDRGISPVLLTRRSF